MHGLAVLLFPAVLILFALVMERMENEVDQVSVHRDQVEEFLDRAEPDEMTTLAVDGFPAALEEFRHRRDALNHPSDESDERPSRAS